MNKTPPSRQAVFEAATPLFVQRGYFGASIRLITDAADISIGSMSRRFPTKSKLFFELLHHHELHLMDAVRQALWRHGPHLLDALADAVIQHRDYFELVVVETKSFEGVYARRLRSKLQTWCANNAPAFDGERLAFALFTAAGFSLVVDLVDANSIKEVVTHHLELGLAAATQKAA